MDRDNDKVSVISVTVDRSFPIQYVKRFAASNPFHYKDYVKVPDAALNASGIYNPSESDNVYIKRKTAYVLAWDILQETNEPALSEIEQNVILNHYAYDIPNGLDDEEFTAWRELITRGIIEPSDLNKDFTLSDMLFLIDKCKNSEKRTNFKQVMLTLDAAKENPFIQKGFVNVQADVEVEDKLVNVSFTDNITNDRYIILDFRNLKGFFANTKEAESFLKKSTLFIKEGDNSIKHLVKGKNVFAVQLKENYMYEDGYSVLLSKNQSKTGKNKHLKGEFLVFNISNDKDGFKDVYVFDDKSVKTVIAQNQKHQLGEYSISGSYTQCSNALSLSKDFKRLGIRVSMKGVPLAVGESDGDTNGSVGIDADYEEPDEDVNVNTDNELEDSAATAEPEVYTAELKVNGKVYAMGKSELIPLEDDSIVAVTHGTQGDKYDPKTGGVVSYNLSLGFNNKDKLSGILTPKERKVYRKGDTITLSVGDLKKRITDKLQSSKALNAVDKKGNKKYDIDFNTAVILNNSGSAQNNGYGSPVNGSDNIVLPSSFTYQVKVKTSKSGEDLKKEKEKLSKVINEKIKVFKSSKSKPISGTSSGGTTQSDLLAYDNLNAYLGTSSDRAGFYIKISDEATSDTPKSAIDKVIVKIEKPKPNIYVLTMMNSEVIVIDNEKKFVYRTNSIFDYSYFKSDEKPIEADGKSLFVRAEVLYGLLGMEISAKAEKVGNDKRSLVTVSYNNEGLSNLITTGGDGRLGLTDLNGMQDSKHKYTIDKNYIFFNNKDRKIAYLPLTQSLPYLPFLLYFSKGDGGAYGRVITFRTLTDGSSKVIDDKGVLQTAPKGYEAKVTELKETGVPKAGEVMFHAKYGPVYVIPQGRFSGIKKKIEAYKKRKLAIPVYFINEGSDDVVNVVDAGSPSNNININNTLQILNYNFVKYGKGGTPLEYDPFNKNAPGKEAITKMYAAPTNMLAFYAPWRKVYDLNSKPTGLERYFFGTDLVELTDNGTLKSTLLGMDSGVNLDKLFTDKAKSGLVRQYRDMQL